MQKNKKNLKYDLKFEKLKKRGKIREYAQPTPPAMFPQPPKCGGGTLTVDGAVGCLFRSRGSVAQMCMVLLSPSCNPTTLQKCMLTLGAAG